MSFLFAYKYKNFNGDISNWDVSRVYSMNSIFEGAESFNQDIGNWDVSRVECMNCMFEGAESFNQDIGNWDVSKTKDKMLQMFTGAISFSYIDQVRNKWLSNRKRTPSHMFKGAGI